GEGPRGALPAHPIGRRGARLFDEGASPAGRPVRAGAGVLLRAEGLLRARRTLAIPRGAPLGADEGAGGAVAPGHTLGLGVTVVVVGPRGTGSRRLLVPLAATRSTGRVDVIHGVRELALTSGDDTPHQHQGGREDRQPSLLRDLTHTTPLTFDYTTDGELGPGTFVSNTEWGSARYRVDSEPGRSSSRAAAQLNYGEPPDAPRTLGGAPRAPPSGPRPTFVDFRGTTCHAWASSLR